MSLQILSTAICQAIKPPSSPTTLDTLRAPPHRHKSSHGVGVRDATLAEQQPIRAQFSATSEQTDASRTAVHLEGDLASGAQREGNDERISKCLARSKDTVRKAVFASRKGRITVKMKAQQS